MTTPKALITGITGQDGSYLAELLLEKGYEVHGLIRRSSSFNTGRIMHLFQDPHDMSVRFYLHYGDLLDPLSLTRLLDKVAPTEIYHLGAQSQVRVSFDIPAHTADVVAMGTARLLEAIWQSQIPTRFYQASSSEMFGQVVEVPQRETTPFHPRSPYGVSKLFAYWTAVNYREAYNLYACNGILFNHESPRRGETFVTRKITRGLAHILSGQQQKIYLGNLEAKRDWGYAPDYVEGMWRMLQAKTPSDYVLATGETHSVREFLERCCAYVRLDPGAVVEIDRRYFRPTEVDLLLGDASKARQELGWEPETTFEQLIQIMLAADLESVGLDPETYGLPKPVDRAMMIEVDE